MFACWGAVTCAEWTSLKSSKKNIKFESKPIKSNLEITIHTREYACMYVYISTCIVSVSLSGASDLF